jgi:hypothetical protein
MKNISLYKILIFFDVFISFSCFSFNTEDNTILYPFTWNEKAGYLDRKFNVFMAPRFDEATHFENGIAVVKYNNSYAFIDTKGNIIKEFQFDTLSELNNGYAIFEKNITKGIINKDGRIIIDNVWDIRFHKDGLFKTGYVAVEIGHRYKYINEKGNIMCNNKDFINAFAFHESMAVVKNLPGIAGRYGLINEEGEFVIEPIYRGILSIYFSEGLWAVYKNGRYIYINIKGETVLELDEKITHAESFYQGVAFIATGPYHSEIYSMINKKGEYIQRDFAVRVNYFREDKAAFKAVVARKPRLLKKWGYIDIKGNIIIEPQFDEASYFYHGYAEIWIKNDEGFVDEKGKIVWVKDIMKDYGKK